LDDKYAYDPDKARELMASVGLEDGFEFDFVVLGAPSDFQLAVQGMLEEEINVKINWVTATSTDQLFASVRSQPMIISEWALGDRPAGFIRGPITTGFMNFQGGDTSAIEPIIGPALGGNPEALNNGWWITVYESKFYSGYDADTVQEPKNAGTNSYLVMTSIQPA
jgi:peptide/nickel transport system substrate-binding protein